jgi:hypothetical protein
MKAKSKTHVVKHNLTITLGSIGIKHVWNGKTFLGSFGDMPDGVTCVMDSDHRMLDLPFMTDEQALEWFWENSNESKVKTTG